MDKSSSASDEGHRAPAVATLSEGDLRELHAHAHAVALADALAWFADRAAENAHRPPRGAEDKAR